MKQQLSQLMVRRLQIVRAVDRPVNGVNSHHRPDTSCRQGQGRCCEQLIGRERSDSPRVKSCDNVASESISLIAAAAPAIDTTLLLKVPPWVNVPPRAGSNAAITSARPPNAPNVIPPARYFPSV